MVNTYRRIIRYQPYMVVDWLETLTTLGKEPLPLTLETSLHKCCVCLPLILVNWRGRRTRSSLLVDPPITLGPEWCDPLNLRRCFVTLTSISLFTSSTAFEPLTGLHPKPPRPQYLRLRHTVSYVKLSLSLFLRLQA